MIPAKTPTSNVVLAGYGGVADLPAERVRLENPEQAGGDVGILSTWLVDEGEVRALANGAPIVLVVTGETHPPISLAVGEPPEETDANPLVNLDHARRAATWLLAELAERLLDDAGLPPAGEVAGLFDRALVETKEASAASKIEAVRERAQIAAEDAAVVTPPGMTAHELEDGSTELSTGPMPPPSALLLADDERALERAGYTKAQIDGMGLEDLNAALLAAGRAGLTESGR